MNAAKTPRKTPRSSLPPAEMRKWRWELKATLIGAVVTALLSVGVWWATVGTRPAVPIDALSAKRVGDKGPRINMSNVTVAGAGAGVGIAIDKDSQAQINMDRTQIVNNRIGIQIGGASESK